MVHTALLARGIPQGVCGELLFKTELENSVFAKQEKYTIGKEKRVVFQLPSWYCTGKNRNKYSMTISLLFQCCCVHTILVGVLLLLQDFLL